ncbi:MAG: hypothetical protein HOO89_12160 [Ferruginibacter sp.]|nr:hypothetical protein [Ferruginibacter sp.]
MKPVPQYDDRRIVFEKVEQYPEFIGGVAEWKKYLQKNLDATLPSKEGWKAGTYQITVRFIVEKDGSINDVTTTDYVNSKTANQCIDLIKKGPKWQPAKQNGHIVTAYRNQPITFLVSE